MIMNDEDDGFDDSDDDDDDDDDCDDGYAVRFEGSVQ